MSISSISIALIFSTVLLVAQDTHTSYDFENIIPKNISVENGKIAQTSEACRDGAKALRWDYHAGDVLTFQTAALGAMPPWQGYGSTMRPAFIFPIYIPHITEKGRLILEFFAKDQLVGELEIPFAFAGWQQITQHYTWNSVIRWKARNSLNQVDRFRLRAVDAEPSYIILDAVDFLELRDWRDSRSPVSEIWKPLIPDFRSHPKPRDEDLKKVAAMEQTWRAQPTNNDLPSQQKRIENVLAEMEKQNVGGAKTGELNAGINLAGNAAHIYHNSALPEIRSQAAKIFLSINQWLQYRGMLVNGAAGQRNNYIGRTWADIAANMRDVLIEGNQLTSTINYLKWSYNYDTIFDLTNNDRSMDFFHNEALRLIKIATMHPDPLERWNHLTAVRKALSRYCVNSIKADGSIYHHGFHYFAYGTMGMNSSSGVAAMMSKHDLPLDESALDAMRLATMRMRWYSGGYPILFSLCGRHPGEPAMNAGTFLNLIQAYRPYRNGEIDKTLAAAYLRLKADQVGKPEWQGIQPEDHPQGNVVMPYAGLGLHRRAHWLAGVHAYSRYVLAGESYANANCYGLYLCNGFLELHTNPAPLPGLYSSGYLHRQGWDWLSPCGTTTIWSSLEKIKNGNGTRSEASGETFVGGLTHREKNGLFVFTLNSGLQANMARTEEQRKKKAGTFQARKSYFFFDDEILCLGSHINLTECDHPVRTTLFQKHLNEQHPAAIARNTNITPTEKPTVISFAEDEPWLLGDAYGNSYAGVGQNLTLQVGLQKSREGNDNGDTEGNWAKAWIDHGKNPQNANYEYLVFVQTSPEEIKNRLAQTKRMQVIRRDDAAHIVHHQPSCTTAYAMWNPSAYVATEHEQIKSASHPCLVMIEEIDDEHVILSLTNPDLRPNEKSPQLLTIKLLGSYIINDPSDERNSTIVDGHTIINASVLHAESHTFHLKKKES